TPAAFDYAFYPSDLYYADLAKADGSFDDWNTQHDGFHADYFGEVRGEKNKADSINLDGIDYLPDVAVGRWPVSDPEQARSLAAKTIAAEQQRAQTRSSTPATQPRLRHAALIAATGWVDTQKHFDRLEGAMQGRWQIERRLF